MQTRRMVIGVATAVVMGVGVLADVAPAQAGPADCPNGHACMWEDPNFGGRMIVDHPGQHGMHEIAEDGDNRISSVVNYTGCMLWLFDGDLSNPGEAGTVPARPDSHHAYPDLGVKNFNDRVESFGFGCP